MDKTVAFVTSQYCCDRIIHAARELAERTDTELLVVGILDNRYELQPEVIDYLFRLSRDNGATMRLLFTGERLGSMRETIGQFDCRQVVTGMPGSGESVLYTLWKDFPDKLFYTADCDGELVEVATGSLTHAV